MDIAQGLAMGFSGALTPGNLLACFFGVLWGTLVGVLPGIGPIGGLALLLPLTNQMDVTPALVMMAGIYYGTMYGGSTTSILASIPGEVASVVTILDGHQMAKKGRAGPALAISAIGSFVAGTIALLGLTFIAPPLVSVALSFGPPEYFALMFLGLTMVSYLSGRSLAKGLMMAIFGLMIGTVGIDIITGRYRYTFNNIQLSSGIDLTPIALGLFGIGEILYALEGKLAWSYLQADLFDFRKLMPTREDLRVSTPAMLRGSVLGFFVGVLPGTGATIASFLAYAIEKRSSKRPEQFGTGVIEGVASPEAANNSAAGGAMITLLALGVPGSVVTALMLNSMIVHGLQPSPLLMLKQPEFFWTLVASMYVGNAMLLVLNLPLVGVWANLLRIPAHYFFPGIVLLCATGVYAVNNSVLDLQLMVFFGLLGYLMRKTDYPGAPIMLGLVLGRLMENSLGQSLIISSGDMSIFFRRPISATILGIAFLVIAYPMVRWLIRRSRPAPALGSGKG